MKVAIYCRLSEEDRNKQFETDDSNSIQNQKDYAIAIRYGTGVGTLQHIQRRRLHRVQIDDARNLTVCSKTQKRTNLILSSAKHNPASPVNWN